MTQLRARIKSFAVWPPWFPVSWAHMYRCLTFGLAVWTALLVGCFVPTTEAFPQNSRISPAPPEGDWEITPASEQALELGLRWLEGNQGPEGNWESNDLGLVSMGVLAFLAAGHSPGRGRYGGPVKRALDYVIKNAKPSGLLNISEPGRDMYNHGLAAFVLGQVYGMTDDTRISQALDRALKLIAGTQCEDGGWDYRALRQQNGHDLSLAVMQAKALRSALDSGLEVPPEVIDLAIRSVRAYYCSRSGRRNSDSFEARTEPGQFTYDGTRGSTAMAACGVVCLQEFGQYDDWRIPKNIDVIAIAIAALKPNRRSGTVPFDAYTLYYIGQAIYQVGGRAWRENYPRLRDFLTETQIHNARDPKLHGLWRDGERVGGKPGDLYGTAVACFILAIPNRYLPILQEGRIDSLDSRRLRQR